MANIDKVQQNFTRGELTPRMFSRYDFDQWYSGVRQLENFTVMPTGGIRKRPGTRYVADAPSNSQTRLIGFEFSVDQTYILEMSDEQVRFYADQGQLVANDYTTSVTNGEFDSDISDWNDESTGSGSIAHDSANGGVLRFNGSAGDTAVANQVFSVSETDTTHTLHIQFGQFNASRGDRLNVVIQRYDQGNAPGETVVDRDVRYGSHLFDIDPDGKDRIELTVTKSGYGDAWMDKVRFLKDEPVYLVAPWTEDQLFTIKWTQSADIMWLCHPKVQPYQMRRRGQTEFSLVVFDFQDGPYLNLYSGDSNNLNYVNQNEDYGELQWDSTEEINDGEGLSSDDVGRVVRMEGGSPEWRWFEIVSVTNSTTAEVEERSAETSDLSNGGDITDTTAWRLGEWGGYTGWPHAAAFHDQRLAFGARDRAPQRVWLSRVEKFSQFSPSATDGNVSNDDAINVGVLSDKVNAIRWLESISNGLVLGTSGSEFLMRPATTTDPLSPNSVTLQRNTNRGSTDTVLPARVGHSVIFAQRGGRTVRELAFDFNINGLQANTLSLLSEHLLRNRVLRMAYQQSNDSILWVLTNDARINGFTLEADQEVFAWHTHRIGGSFNGADAFVESMEVIDEGEVDRVWLVVRRDINGSPVRYVEFLETPWEGDADPIEDAFFVDSGITYDGSATTTISNLDHLEGEEVAVLVDGAAHPRRTVENGEITLQYEGEKVQVGLPFTAQVKSFPFEQVGRTDTTSGRVKRIDGLHITMLNTVGLKFGRVEDNLDFVYFRDSSDEMDQALDPFTGTKTVNFKGGHSLEAQWVLVSDQPLPCFILAVTQNMEVYGPSR